MVNETAPGTPALGTDGKPLLQYPLDYPIKVVHRRDTDTPGSSVGDRAARERLDDIVRRHAPDFDATRITERASREARFVAITYVIVARSREQIVALVSELSTSDGVLMVI